MLVRSIGLTKKNKSGLVIFALLIVLCFAATAKAQEAKVVEKLSSGDQIVTIDGVEYRAVTAETWRKVLEERVKLESALLREQVNRRQIDALLAENTRLRDTITQLRRPPGLLARLFRWLF